MTGKVSESLQGTAQVSLVALGGSRGCCCQSCPGCVWEGDPRSHREPWSAQPDLSTLPWVHKFQCWSGWVLQPWVLQP